MATCWEKEQKMHFAPSSWDKGFIVNDGLLVSFQLGMQVSDYYPSPIHIHICLKQI